MCCWQTAPVVNDPVFQKMSPLVVSLGNPSKASSKTPGIPKNLDFSCLSLMGNNEKLEIDDIWFGFTCVGLLMIEKTLPLLSVFPTGSFQKVASTQ